MSSSLPETLIRTQAPEKVPGVMQEIVENLFPHLSIAFLRALA